MLLLHPAPVVGLPEKYLCSISSAINSIFIATSQNSNVIPGAREPELLKFAGSAASAPPPEEPFRRSELSSSDIKDRREAPSSRGAFSASTRQLQSTI